MLQLDPKMELFLPSELPVFVKLPREMDLCIFMPRKFLQKKKEEDLLMGSYPSFFKGERLKVGLVESGASRLLPKSINLGVYCIGPEDLGPTTTGP